MKSKMIWLRMSYWAPAIADFFIAVTVLIPEKVGLTEFVYPMGMMSAVAFSWGILLVLADRKPVERRWVLIPTIIVVALLICVGIYAALKNLIELDIVFLIIGITILVIMIYGYLISGSIEKAN